MKRPALAVTALLLSCCATTPGLYPPFSYHRQWLTFPEAPAPEGWKRVHTPDFELVTNLDADATERGARLLTEVIAAMRALFVGGQSVGPASLTIYAVATDAEFQAHFTRYAVGWSVDDHVLLLSGPPERWLRLAINGNRENNVSLRRALAQALIESYLPGVPPWFKEGLSQYLETAAWKTDREVLLGYMNLSAYNAYVGGRAVRVTDLPTFQWRHWKQPNRQYDELRGLAWAWVWYMLRNEPELMTQVMAAFARGEAAEAQRMAFPELGPPDKDIYQYFRTHRVLPQIVTVEPVAPLPAIVEPAHMSDPDFDQLEALMDKGDE